jgi:hypothetical protein
MAKLHRWTGETIEVLPKSKCFTSEELQLFVGGHTSAVISNNRCLIVNEVGNLLDLPENHIASELSGIGLVGDVVEMTLEEWEAVE